jgi:tRNA G26 N,N-dimethylase Trm1
VLPFSALDSAVQAVATRGLLCVSALVKDVLKETKMDAFRTGNRAFSNELAVRLLLAQLERHANRNSRFIVPIFSHDKEGEVSVYVRLYSGMLKEVNRSVLRVGNVFQVRVFHLTREFVSSYKILFSDVKLCDRICGFKSIYMLVLNSVQRIFKTKRLLWF